MLNSQLEMPSSGDWVTTCIQNLEYLGIELTFEEIRNMSKKKYSEIIKERLNQVSLKYLMDKRGKKGSEIRYSCVEMSEYLLPFNNELTIEEKCELFAVKNRMINIPFNFSSKCEYECKCGRKEDMNHIYECELYNEG